MDRKLLVSVCVCNDDVCLYEWTTVNLPLVIFVNTPHVKIQDLSARDKTVELEASGFRFLVWPQDRVWLRLWRAREIR